MRKFSKFSAMLAAAVILPSLFSAIPASAAIYSAPSLKSPTSNQTLTNYPRNTSFTWNAVSGAKSYKLEVACDVCVSKTTKWQGAKTYTVSGTSYSVKMLGDNEYRWRVRAVDSSSNLGPWSGYSYFKYRTGKQNTTTPTTIGTPTLVSPADGATISHDYVDLDWSSVTDATSYEYEVTKYNGSSWESIRRGNISASNATVSLPYGDYGQYRLHVRAIKNGSYGSWSENHQFYYSNGSSTTGAPTIYGPYEDQTFSSRDVSINWSNVSGAASYEVNVNYYQDGSWVNQGTYTAYTNPYSLTFYNDNNYRLRVRAVLSGSTYGNWSDWREFVVGVDNTSYYVGTPTLVSPADEATVSSNYINLDWSSVSGATSYEYEVTKYTGSTWGSVKYGTTLATDATISFAYGDYGQYSFHVRAIKNGSYGNWSEYNQFYYSNGSYTTGAPTIYSPSEDQTLSNHNVNIDWSDVSGAASYEVNVNYYQDGSWVNQGTYTAYQNPYSLTLYNDDNYRVRIRAVLSGYTYGNWSDWREFVVGTGGGDGSYNYEAPTVYTPNAGVTYGTQVYTYWSANGDAESYKINVQYKTGSSWYEERTQTVSGATSVILTFGNDNDYRLRVQTVFPGGSVSSWSEWREFSVDGNSSDYSDSSAPTVYDPYNGETFTSDSVYMSWSTISGAVSYEVEIDYKSGSYWYDEGTYPTSYQNYTKVFYSDNDYRMRVRAKYSGGTYTSWSNWYEFTVDETGGYDYSPPTISEPENNETFTAETVYIGWTSVYTAVSYEVEIDYKSGSNWYDEGTYTTSNLYYIKTFSGDNNYRVRARAKFSDNSYTNWSAWREFVVNAD